MKKIRLFVCGGRLVLFLTVTLCACTSWGQTAANKVRISFDKPLHSSVKAMLDVPDGRVFIDHPAGGYGWEKFIKNLRLVRKDGSTVLLPSAGNHSWRLPPAVAGPVRLNDDVDLAFTEKSRLGDLRGGQFFGDSLYLVNRTLFVMSKAPGPREIVFEVPPDFPIATPWEKTGEHLYRTPDNQDLASNCTILGRFAEIHAREGQFQITFVLPGATASEQSPLEPLFKPVLHESLRIFPNTPPTRLFFTFFHGWEDNGEAYRNSATLTIPATVTRTNGIIWANLFAHEIFHHWNGGLITGEDEKVEWFAEGAMEYMANRTLLRSGVISSDLFLKMMETHVAMYDYWMWSPIFKKISLQDAAMKTTLPTIETDAKTYNRPGIYSGGWVASFCLDTMIQKSSHGQKGLDDLFRLMMRQFGLTGKRFTPGDLVRNASEVAGTDLNGLFTKHIFARESLPVQQCLADAGFDVNLEEWAGEAFISPALDLAPSALAIRQQLLAEQP